MSKVLIIDDELEICKQVSLILSKNGYETSYVTSHKELLNLLTNGFTYDLVLVLHYFLTTDQQERDHM